MTIKTTQSLLNKAFTIYIITFTSFFIEAFFMALNKRFKNLYFTVFCFAYTFGYTVGYTFNMYINTLMCLK